MSTSSGRPLDCSRCGHSMNEHSSTKESKCRKCKKTFDICQAGIHGYGSGTKKEGWRICLVPCNCGVKYYPDKAKIARLLEPHEYMTSHPGYRALEPETAEYDEVAGSTQYYEQEATTYDEPEYQSTHQPGYGLSQSAGSDDPLASSDTVGTVPFVSGPSRTGRHARHHSHSSDDPLATDKQPLSGLEQLLSRVDIGSNTGLSTSYDQTLSVGETASDDVPIFVETEVKHGTVRFSDPADPRKKCKTQTEEWQEIFSDEGSYFLHTNKFGKQFWTLELGSASRHDASGSKGNTKKSRVSNVAGKGKHRKGK